MARWEPMLERVAQERYARLVAYAMLLTRSQPDAADLVQDALVSTFSGRARFATLAETEAYVRRAIVSRYVDAGRRSTAERRAVARAASLSGGGTPVTQGIGRAGLEPELVAALGLLSPRERACVVLRHMEDLSTRETASVLRISEGAVKRYVFDGVRTLSAALGAVAAEHVPVVERSAPDRPGSAPRRLSVRKEVRDA